MLYRVRLGSLVDLSGRRALLHVLISADIHSVRNQMSESDEGSDFASLCVAMAIIGADADAQAQSLSSAHARVLIITREIKGRCQTYLSLE